MCTKYHPLYRRYGRKAWHWLCSSPDGQADWRHDADTGRSAGYWKRRWSHSAALCGNQFLSRGWLWRSCPHGRCLCTGLHLWRAALSPFERLSEIIPAGTLEPAGQQRGQQLPANRWTLTAVTGRWGRPQGMQAANPWRTSCRALFQLRQIPDDCRKPSGLTADEYAGHLERRYAPSMGQPLHGQCQHADELLAGRSLQLVRMPFAIVWFDCTDARPGTENCKGNVPLPRLCLPSQYRYLGRYRSAGFVQACNNLADWCSMALPAHFWTLSLHTRPWFLICSLWFDARSSPVLRGLSHGKRKGRISNLPVCFTGKHLSDKIRRNWQSLHGGSYGLWNHHRSVSRCHRKQPDFTARWSLCTGIVRPAEEAAED